MSTKFVIHVATALTLVIGGANAASAQSWRNYNPPNWGGGNYGGGYNGGGNNGGGTHSAPELDPSTGASALALLSGGLLVVRGRRRQSSLKS